MTYTAYPPAAPNNQAILSSQSEAVSHVDISEQSAGSWETVMYWSFRAGKLKLHIIRVGNWLGYYFCGWMHANESIWNFNVLLHQSVRSVLGGISEQATTDVATGQPSPSVDASYSKPAEIVAGGQVTSQQPFPSAIAPHDNPVPYQQQQNIQVELRLCLCRSNCPGHYWQVVYLK